MKAIDTLKQMGYNVDNTYQDSHLQWCSVIELMVKYSTEVNNPAPEVKQQEAPDSVCAKCGGKGFYPYNSTDEKTTCSCRSNNWEFLYNLVKEENEAKGKKLHELEKAYNKLGVQFDREMTRLQERSMDDLNRIKELEEQLKRKKK